MCDTFVALANSTADGSVIFGKNSDREPNEAHELVLIPRAHHQDGEKVSCTYIELPQVRDTNAVLLSKPFWIWGAEMGANEHGLVIGNEAVFTKVPYEKEPGLIGMDFLRLALERTSSAKEALALMIDLLETYGQGGNCGFNHSMFYHNGFLIADPQEAWVFETAGKHWAAERVKDVRSISNVISIGSTWDLASDDLVTYAVDKGWCRNKDDFDFGRCYSDLIYTKFSDGQHRLCRSTALLSSHIGEIDVPFAMAVLRDHGPDADQDWQPGKGVFGAEICMHASFGPVRGSQTTGSMISHLKPGLHTHWVTGTAAPCTSIFKPIWIDTGLPEIGPAPDGTYDQATLWWRHENLHREILRDYSTRIKPAESDRKSIEKNFMQEADALTVEMQASRKALSQSCFDRAQEAEADWLKALKNCSIKHRRPVFDKLAWEKFDRQADRV
ncbi:MAG: C69 family dipeptidase [Chloroflexota bacterium]|nr:C69 family dipeptidase [Chloroflexota bacterium]